MKCFVLVFLSGSKQGNAVGDVMTLPCSSLGLEGLGTCFSPTHMGLSPSDPVSSLEAKFPSVQSEGSHRSYVSKVGCGGYVSSRS